MIKLPLRTYASVYSKCEEILNVKTVATSGEILDELIQHYDIGNLKVTAKGITYYLKSKKYLGLKYYKTKATVFVSCEYAKKVLKCR